MSFNKYNRTTLVTQTTFTSDFLSSGCNRSIVSCQGGYFTHNMYTGSGEITNKKNEGVFALNYNHHDLQVNCWFDFSAMHHHA